MRAAVKQIDLALSRLASGIAVSIRQHLRMDGDLLALVSSVDPVCNPAAAEALFGAYTWGKGTPTFEAIAPLRA